jgi:hypothetical protein
MDTNDLDALQSLIRLLKTEGVSAYEHAGTRIVFSEGRLPVSVGPVGEAGPKPAPLEQPEAPREQASVELPQAAKGLNPNYWRLTNVVKR